MKSAMINIINRGIALISAQIPGDWDESSVLRLDDETITITFNQGEVNLSPVERDDAQSIIQLSKKRLCDIIDGSIDFMVVWRELAEPSPTDRTYIRKGSGAKLFALLDSLIKCYQSNQSFRKMVDDYKAQLNC